MNKELQDKLDEFIFNFKEEPCVKQFLILKEEMDSSLEIAALKENLKTSQKEMALSLGKEDYSAKKMAYLKAKRAYEDNPLVVNYNYLVEEVYLLLDELKEKLK